MSDSHHEAHAPSGDSDETTGPMMLVAAIGLGAFFAFVGGRDVGDHSGVDQSGAHGTAAEHAAEIAQDGSPSAKDLLDARRAEEQALEEMAPRTPDDAAAEAAAKAMAELQRELATEQENEEPARPSSPTGTTTSAPVPVKQPAAGATPTTAAPSVTPVAAKPSPAAAPTAAAPPVAAKPAQPAPVAPPPAAPPVAPVTAPAPAPVATP